MSRKIPCRKNKPMRVSIGFQINPKIISRTSGTKELSIFYRYVRRNGETKSAHHCLLNCFYAPQLDERASFPEALTPSAYANKRKISAKTAGSPCFTIIDLFEVKPPKMAAMTTQMTKNI